MADEEDQKPFVIYTTENFETMDLLKELEEKKNQVIYLKELLERKEEENETLKVEIAKLRGRKLREDVTNKRKRGINTTTSMVDATTVPNTKKKIRESLIQKAKIVPIQVKPDNSCDENLIYVDQNNLTNDSRAIEKPSTSGFKVTRNTLIHVHERYQRVLDVVKTEGCSNRQAYKRAGIARSTVRDMIGIAELKIVDREEYEKIVKEMRKSMSVKHIEAACRKKLGDLKKKMISFRSEGKLLPIAFHDGFYSTEPRKRITKPDTPFKLDTKTDTTI